MQENKKQNKTNRACIMPVKIKKLKANETVPVVFSILIAVGIIAKRDNNS